MAEKTRIAKWDNFKFFLIVTVVVGHVINLFRKDSALLTSLYFFIYTFHMPAFLFVSGLFAKKTIKYKRYDKIFSWLILYFSLKFIYFLTRIWAYGQKSFKLFEESGFAWYVFAIFVFSLLTIFLQQYKAGWVIIAAIVFGCFAGYDKNLGNFLVLARITAFYPFFLFGFYLDSERIVKVTDKIWVKVLSAVVLLGIVFLSLKHVDSLYWLMNLLKGKYPYAELNKWNIYGGFLRLGHYAIAMLITFSWIAWMPKRHCFFSKLGSRTLQIYGFHYLLVVIFDGVLNGRELLKNLWPEHYSYLVILVAFAIIAITSLKPFTFFIEKIAYPPKASEAKEEQKV